jgi:REP element-mobilizing transposase RayT
MHRTLGYHIVISGYGLWLPGDGRGHRSEAWDEELGFIEPHKLHPGDPVRKRMAEERQKHSAVRLNGEMQQTVIDTMTRCQSESNWQIAAASIEPTHIHLLLTYSERNIDSTVKWLKDQARKAIHHDTSHTGPVWCKGRWRSYIFEDEVWENTQLYIQRHDERRGEALRPYSFIDIVVP